MVVFWHTCEKSCAVGHRTRCGVLHVMSTEGSVLSSLSVDSCMLFGTATASHVLFGICAYFLHGCGKSRAVGHEHRRLDTARHERKTSCALDLSAEHNARSGMTTKSHVLSCIYLMFAREASRTRCSKSRAVSHVLFKLREHLRKSSAPCL